MQKPIYVFFQVIEEFLNETCIKTNDEPLHSTEFEMELGFHFLAKKPSAKKPGDRSDPIFPEMEGLWHISRSKEHAFLLNHVVIDLFIKLKWELILELYRRRQRFTLLFVNLLTLEILSLYGGRQYDILGLYATGDELNLDGWKMFYAFLPAIIMVSYLLIFNHTPITSIE